MIASSNSVARSAGQTFPLVPLSAAARARREARSAPRRDVPDMMDLLRSILGSRPSAKRPWEVPSRRLANTTSSRPARSCSGPFDGGDDALGEAAGEGDREIGGAGRDRPADGEGGPPSHHKIIPLADTEERQRPAHDKSDNGGDHDRKDKSCFAFHASL